MKRIRLLLSIPLALLLLAAGTLAQTDVAQRRERMLEVARLYATHVWRAAESNRFHGVDADGVPVDTPDASYSEGGWRPGPFDNVGVPYRWGGFSSLEEFDRGLERGLFAGHIQSGKRAQGSRHAVGVDCSGFVARCWDLPEKQSTRSIGGLCYELGSWDELRPGDVLNRYDSHVMLFAGWADGERTRIRVFEAVDPCVREREHEVAPLRELGFVPLRYRPLDPRWEAVAVDFSAPSATYPEDAPRAWTGTGSPRPLDVADLGAPYAPEGPRGWTRLRIVTRGEETDEPEVELLAQGFARGRVPVGGPRPDSVTLHVQERSGSQGLDTLVEVPRAASRLDAWIPLILVAGVPERSREVLSSTVQDGVYRIGDERLDARRVRIELLLLYPGGSDDIPVGISIDAIASDDVPLAGLLGGDFHLEVLADPEDPTEVDVRVDLIARG